MSRYEGNGQCNQQCYKRSDVCDFDSDGAVHAYTQRTRCVRCLKNKSDDVTRTRRGNMTDRVYRQSYGRLGEKRKQSTVRLTVDFCSGP